ncbi:CDP-2,3-bis-(O-geranylgeranyl)-sn-glycerol synthase [Candidatus Bathyarchaeota archaeon]|nr:CDP-2,3-bis-(O-geranylgeranyl)-sn-glycerol synthase [Candidatus Bathyarchaeota archaeon]
MNLSIVLVSIWKYLPAYFANATPVALGGGPPLDGGDSWLDGKPFLGSHKTLRGCMVGVLAGLLIGLLQGGLIVGFLQGFGAILGDLLSSFLKRRWDVAPGDSFPLLDQLDFITVAVLLSQPFVQASLVEVVVILVVTVPLHYLTNYVSWLTGMKDNPW